MAEQLQELVDRAAISDLLFSFARALDTKDYQTYHDNFVDGSYVELPDPMAPGATIILRKERMLELVPQSIGRYTATQLADGETQGHQARVLIAAALRRSR